MLVKGTGGLGARSPGLSQRSVACWMGLKLPNELARDVRRRRCESIAADIFGVTVSAVPLPEQEAPNDTKACTSSSRHERSTVTTMLSTLQLLALSSIC
jgi:hypothetical protein